MANIKGGRAARKRDRQNAKARARNSAVKARLHTEHKRLFKAADAGKKEKSRTISAGWPAVPASDSEKSQFRKMNPVRPSCRARSIPPSANR